MNSGPSLHRYQPDQVQRVGWRYPSLSVTRLPGDEDVIGARSVSVQQDEYRDGNDARQNGAGNPPTSLLFKHCS
ncbi:hypothetical protein GGR91_000544 [Sphingorhabdus rigui]|uniref:Uncharacterized protein n=1 Tax=Sphingorhabdus rigui TaxID=1282858 RepID=A0A840AZ78_9SPHN|nr:hypothetical protein [Sphingorhabdus rigui]